MQHDRRFRKTGPTHPIVVLRCEVHEASFSVYPPGFVPYARRQLVEGPAQHEVPSLMEVVERAAEVGPVERKSLGKPEGSWSTQNRLVDRATMLFGLRDRALRQRIAVATSISLLQLEASARCQGIRARARAVLRLRKGLDVEVLLGLGALVGLWGPPRRWCARRDQLVPTGLSP